MVFKKIGMTCAALLVAGCSVNPATGDRQFTALMPAGQEAQIGASEHQKILQQYGGPFENRALEAYVNRVGQKIVAGTERPEINYKFSILDTPVMNAFAIPGGYIYVSRGLLTLAGSEAQLAAVLAHEIGHITARHSAERYSQGVLAGLGVAVLSAAVKDPGLARVAGVGSELALKSYSRTQEYQADELGIRYLSRAGYDPFAAAEFLNILDHATKYETHRAGRKDEGGPSYFSTHPQTDDRVARASQIATGYPVSNLRNVDNYLEMIKGLTYGESARTGFFDGRRFIHPELELTFVFPLNFQVGNQPDRVVGIGKSGNAIIFDGVHNQARQEIVNYMRDWMAGQGKEDRVQSIRIHGMPAATAEITGTVNGQSAPIRLVAIAWDDDQIYRFQIAMPDRSSGEEAALKEAVYSFRPLTDKDRQELRPMRIDLVRATPKDTVASLAANMRLNQTEDQPVDLFRILNGLGAREQIEPGRLYKIIR